MSADTFRAVCAELLAAWQKGDDIFGPMNRARALLAQFDPEGPTDEELLGLMPQQLRDDLETVSWLDVRCAAGIAASISLSALDFARAVLARHGHPTPQPVAVGERLPEPSVKVIAHYFNALGKGRTICAIWVPAKSRSDEGDLDSDDFLEYDEENDKYHWPEGWYEAIENWEDIGWARVYEGDVAYWQPLPKWPATPATPEVTND